MGNHVDPKDLKDPKMMTSISTLETIRTLISTLTLRTISQQREEREKRKEVPHSSKRNVKEKMVTAKVKKNSTVSTTVNSMVNSTMIRNHVDPKDLKAPKMMTSISTLKTKRTLISTLETIRTLISTLTLRTISQQREEREKRKEVPNSS